MNYEDIFNELKALQNRAFSLSKKDKKYIRDTSKDLSIEFIERENCQNCFADQIINLLIATKKHLVFTENLNCDYEVIGGRDVVIMGVRINSNTITNELAEWLIKWFRKHKEIIKKK